MKILKNVLPLAMLLFLAVVANAQDAPRSPLAKPGAADTRAQQQTDRMAAELGLDDTQKQALLELNKTTSQKQQNFSRGQADKKNESAANARAAKVKAGKDAQKEYDDALKAILTPEQYKTWSESRPVRGNQKND